jgi:CDP-diglyceride synthetase
MFDTAHLGMNLTLVHPPVIIFVLLIGLTIMGAILVGYNASENQQKNPIHLLSYVLLMAFIIYVIINIEYPRVGFIRSNAFDQLLVDVRKDMGK